MYAYLASHFFNDAMFRWTEDLARFLEEHTDLTLYVPQRNSSINDKRENDAIITDIAIAEADTRELRKSNLLIACLDGLSIDDGVAGEIMAHGVMKEIEEEQGNGIPRMIIGILTDMRWQGTGDNHLYRNLMILGKVKQHGHLVVGYPGEDGYKEEVLKHVLVFQEKNR